MKDIKQNMLEYGFSYGADPHREIIFKTSVNVESGSQS